MAMVATSSNPPSNTHSNNINSSNDGGGKEKGPKVFLFKYAVAGALTGYVFLLGSGLQRKGFIDSFAEGRSYAKISAIYFGVHSSVKFVNWFLKKLRGKDHGIAKSLACKLRDWLDLWPLMQVFQVVTGLASILTNSALLVVAKFTSPSDYLSSNIILF